MAAFMNIVPEHRRLEIGHIWYAPSAQRTEANTEAAYLMIREAFDGLGNRRLEWKCDALNERSRAAATRLGFTFEGVFRKHMIVRGRSRDSAWYSLLDTEWPAARDALERWLEADAGRRPPLVSLGGDAD
jgi:RimJ/RimL family protein N-acetyltransferase